MRSESLHENDESWEARVCMRIFLTLVPRSNENKSCMRVDESWQARVYMRVFSTLMPQSNENKSCMRVDESWWELTSESLHESFLNSRCPVKREQELHESWRELTSESLHKSFSILVAWWNKNKNYMRLEESGLDITGRVAKTLISSHQNLEQFQVDECARDSRRIVRVSDASTLIRFKIFESFR